MDLILKYFKNLSTQQIDQFHNAVTLYKEWNEKINVISRKDIDFILERHILHSLAIAKFIDFKSGTKVLDVGTGGGFPGVPLAIFFPEVKFTLIDSIGKKIKVVTEVSNQLGLKNVVPLNGRAEDVEGKFDFVVSRAVTKILPFYHWVRNKFEKESAHGLKNGILYLKGGDLTEELSELKKSYKIFEIQSFYEEEFFETKKILYVPVNYQ
ncbi:MAG TPA: 16S rRNA (guanine(527)-N(7))-methyltransferase RsmG [Cytophagaceae bacterium]